MPGDSAGDEPMVNNAGAVEFEVIGLAGVPTVTVASVDGFDLSFAGDWNVKGVGDLPKAEALVCPDENIPLETCSGADGLDTWFVSFRVGAGEPLPVQFRSSSVNFALLAGGCRDASTRPARASLYLASHLSLQVSK